MPEPPEQKHRSRYRYIPLPDEMIDALRQKTHAELEQLAEMGVPDIVSSMVRSGLVSQLRNDVYGILETFLNTPPDAAVPH